MYQFLSNKRILGYIAACLAVLSVIYVTSRERAGLTRWEELIRESMRPLLSIISDIASGLNRSLWALTHIGQLSRENVALTRQVLELKAQLLELAEYKAENDRLRRLLGFREAAPYATVAARVIGRDPSRLSSTLLIDKGQKDGVAKDMAVITFGGLVGRVISVTANTATVLPVIDPRSAVGGIIYRTRDLVLVEGYAGSPGLCMLKPLSSDADIVAGDQVLSSGLGGVFPKGLLVGRVVEVTKGKYSVGKVALVEPDVDFSKLEEVLVITGGSAGRTDSSRAREVRP
ncbi:MAG TPA: rod shape-determining protein MreC [Firmicutes bacterium]|nr:rod shape-determining protein MreC [Bacillota bacterium]